MRRSRQRRIIPETSRRGGWQRPNEPASFEIGNPLDRPREVSPRHYIPGPHPEDPRRDEFQAPWSPGDPQRDANVPYGVPFNEGWGDYALTSPWARPQSARSFWARGNKLIAVPELDKPQVIASFSVPQNREGRLLVAAGQSVTPADLINNDLGADLAWSLRLSGGTHPDLPDFTGIWSSLERPALLVINLASQVKLELLVAAPVAGGARRVQGYLMGWTAPIVRGGGRVTAGWMEP